MIYRRAKLVFPHSGFTLVNTRAISIVRARAHNRHKNKYKVSRARRPIPTYISGSNLFDHAGHRRNKTRVRCDSPECFSRPSRKAHNTSPTLFVIRARVRGIHVRSPRTTIIVHTTIIAPQHTLVRKRPVYSYVDDVISRQSYNKI